MKFLQTLSLFAALGATGLASAGVAYTSFGPGDSYDLGGSGWAILSPTSPDGKRFGYQSVAFQFASTLTDTVSSIDVAAYSFQGTPALIQVDLMEDNAGAAGTKLGSWTTTIGTGIGVYSLATSGAPKIVAGQKYWLGLLGLDANEVSWIDTNIHPLPQVSMERNYDTIPILQKGTQSAFRVNTGAVPEPASMLALSLGLIGIARRRKVK